jgi:hypothetical protein
MTKLEGRLRSCMYDLVDRFEKNLREINELSTILGFGAKIGRPEFFSPQWSNRIGQKSCDFLQYCMERVYEYPDSQIVFVDSKLNHHGQLYVFPSLDEIIKMTSPCSHECDCDGYTYNENSKDLRVNEMLQLYAFAQYKETYEHRQQKHNPVIWRLPERIIEFLDIDKYFTNDFEIPKNQ